MKRIIVATLALFVSQGVGGALALGGAAQGGSAPKAREGVAPSPMEAKAEAGKDLASGMVLVAGPSARAAASRPVAGPSARAEASRSEDPRQPVAAAAGRVLGEREPPEGGSVEHRWGRGGRGAHDSPTVAVIVPIAFFLTVVGIVLISLLMGFRKERLRHETLRLMVERGAEIPVALLTGPAKRRSSDLRKGAIWVAVGLGISAALAVLAHDEPGHAWAIGLVPLLLGAGYLLVWRLEGRDAAPEASWDEAVASGAPGTASAAGQGASLGGREAEMRRDETYPSA